ncbi:MAG: hypothetical protein COX19_06615 [Desulfobacterales bacterium CG23_combo_of_CG06-09_8_20_14_all_51_8]|nr:MAG: hypothetical protein COX19_06615 [Desulfobacterales bacterium CG23_combo_of_CG06-09_8_20_14_all_51_8]
MTATDERGRKGRRTLGWELWGMKRQIAKVLRMLLAEFLTRLPYWNWSSRLLDRLLVVEEGGGMEKGMIEKIRDAGISPPEQIINDGSIHRFPSNGDASDKAGYYLLYPDGGGFFGCWRSGIYQTVKPDGAETWTDQDRAAYRQKIEQAKAEATAQREREQAEAAEKARKIRNSAAPANPEHAYLKKKQIGPHGARQTGKTLILSIEDLSGKIVSIQSIDPEGKKKFLPGGKISGGFMVIGGRDFTQGGFICEGYATGASIHEATGKPVIVAFNSGNLPAVAEAFKDHPLTIAADNDLGTKIKTGKNPGIEAAKKAADVSGLPCLVCPVDSDFNDLAVKYGTETLKKFFNENVLNILNNLNINDSSQQFSTKNTPEPPQNLAGNIKQFIENSTGSFHTRDIDAEFGLKTRKEKQARSSALLYLYKKNFINKDKSITGRWHIIDSSIDWIDLDAPAEENFPLVLPFGLSEAVSIPPKAIIILAGSTNAGKTAFIFNTLRLNLGSDFKKTYLMSEMGPGEYITRLKSFNEPLDKWKEVNAASRSYDFNGAIAHHNLDGLTCIDYLEEIDGEYFKIASDIRNVYDALGGGVAIIAIQKKASNQTARGGEATMEKSRLYLTLDYLATKENSIVCALKITKLKNFIGKNLQNHELHFEINRGAQISKVMDWTPCAKVDRERCKAEYERTNPETDLDQKDYAVTFRTDAGRIVGMNNQDYSKLLQTHGMVAAEILEEIAADSFKREFIKDKGWFFQVPKILKKKIAEREAALV